MVQQHIINGDFEDPVGGFTGWTTEGACAIVERNGDHCAQLSEPAHVATALQLPAAEKVVGSPGGSANRRLSAGVRPVAL